MKLSCRTGVEALIYSKLDCRWFCLYYFGYLQRQRYHQIRTSMLDGSAKPKITLFFMSNAWRKIVVTVNKNVEMNCSSVMGREVRYPDGKSDMLHVHLSP